ncbi:MAG: DUF4153 domain-containing protein [Bacteroidales bacterium]|nr:MAG: DUF4153 domain-containing protein [Bacteroidales bacterium]
MKEKIRENINRPDILEELYRENKKAFSSDFENVYSEIENYELAKFWKVRLAYEKQREAKIQFRGYDILLLIAVCIITGFLAKLPEVFSFDENYFFFYHKNGGIILFFGLSSYAILLNKIYGINKLFIITLSFLIPVIYINLLPFKVDSHSINLAYIHLPLLMWCIYGLIYINFSIRDKYKLIDYIKYNGDLVVIGSLILLAGVILTGITIGLFSVIDINIENFYTEYIVIVGLFSAPVVTTFIIRNYPVITNKIAPIIANIFSPLVLATLVIYLIVIPFSGKDLYEDRDFLLVFNLMLIGVMGIIVFSVSEISKSKKQQFNKLVLFILSIVTLIIDLIALSAIFYRLGEYGISPNRIAVLGSNILIFGNLVIIMVDLFKVNFRNSNIEKVELSIAGYLPVYMAWTIIVVFGFPALFSFN